MNTQYNKLDKQTISNQRHHYICYSPLDGQEQAVALYNALQPMGVPVWIDVKEVRDVGMSADAQMDRALRGCETLLLVVTAESVSEYGACVREWMRALQYKKPIIPIKITPNPDVYSLPFALEGRAIVDVSDITPFEQAAARVREHLHWRQTDEGVLQTLVERMADAQRELRQVQRVGNSPREWQIRNDIDYLREQITAQQGMVENPEQRAQETQLRIESSLEQGNQSSKHISEPLNLSTQVINSPPFMPPHYFQSRTVEIGLMTRYIADPTCRLITVIGRGGVGKTAMVCYLLMNTELALDGIVYLSSIGARTPSVPYLVTDLCKLLPDEEAATIASVYRNPQSTTRQLMQHLLAAFIERRIVVLMDNFDVLVDSEQQTIQDDELAEALTTLLDAPHHGVTVLLTTRVLPRDLQLHLTASGRQQTLALDNGLELEPARTVLHALDEDGRIGLRDAAKDLINRIWQHTRGYPRALEIVGAILKADRYTTPDEVLTQSEAYITAVSSVPQVANLRYDIIVEALVGQAYSRLDPLAQQVMQALAVYNRPITVAAIDYLLEPVVAGINSTLILQRLVNMHFVRRDGQNFSLHSLDQAYAFGQIPAGNASVKDVSIWAQTSLISRAADYFKTIRTPSRDWHTLDDLDPQLAEFDLRCKGGDYDTAADVLTDIDFPYMLLWGHFRLMAQMHELLLGRVVDKRLKSLHLGHLGLAYYNMGQVERAIDCYQVALVLAKKIKSKRLESAWLGNLGNAYRRLSRVSEAIGYYDKALALAREIGDCRYEGNHLGNLASAQRDLGNLKEAIGYYEQALTIARKIGNRFGEGIDLGNLGLAHVDLGEVWKAIGYYKQALAIAYEVGDHRSEGIHKENMGRAYAIQGDDEKAVEWITQGLEIHRANHNRLAEGVALRTLGYTYGIADNWSKAINLYQQSLSILGHIGDRMEQVNTWNDLAEAYLALDQLDDAKDALDRALALAEAVGNRRGVADAQWLLGKYYLALDGDDVRAGSQMRAQAVAAMMVCVAYFEEIGHVDAAARRAEVEALAAASE